jgi:hypothetical protein
MNRGNVLVVLEVVTGVEPIAGSLHTRGCDPQPFCGWLELASLNEQARGTEVRRGASEHPSEGSPS